MGWLKLIRYMVPSHDFYFDTRFGLTKNVNIHEYQITPRHYN